MIPLTKEQAEALAVRIEARATMHWLRMNQIDDQQTCRQSLISAGTLEDLATEIRNGTFIEVQP